jgi:tRNA (guanine-N7-)-methyltransferase
VSSDSTQTIASGAELVPANCFALLDFEEIFGRRARVEVDLGCGDGSYLSAIAAANPDTDFLGVERLLGRVRTTGRRVQRFGLTNVRVLRFEISYVVERLLPDASTSVFHIMFPDPWPKRRHAPRRLVNDNFLAALHRALIPDGVVRIATDDTEYFRQIMRIVSQSPLFAVAPEVSALTATSKFERRFTQGGIEIHRLSLRKVSPVRNSVACQ